MQNIKKYVLLNWHEGQFEKFNFIEEGVDSIVEAMTVDELLVLIGKQSILVEDLVTALDNDEFPFNEDGMDVIHSAYNFLNRLMEVANKTHSTAI